MGRRSGIDHSRRSQLEIQLHWPEHHQRRRRLHLLHGPRQHPHLLSVLHRRARLRTRGHLPHLLPLRFGLTLLVLQLLPQKLPLH